MVGILSAAIIDFLIGPVLRAQSNFEFYSQQIIDDDCWKASQSQDKSRSDYTIHVMHPYISHVDWIAKSN